MLKIERVRKTFFPHTPNERVALAGIDLTLGEGDFITVIGSNGAGKSTLLNIVSGTYRPDSGSVWIDGEDVTRLPEFRVAKNVSRVFQDPMAGTAPNLTIEENLALALARGQRRGLGWGVTKARRDLFRRELATLELGLERRLGARVGLLSGGQRQALTLLMATFSEPRILLLDEHTAALDPQRAELITKLTAEAVDRYRLTALMVTHNMDQALHLGNRLVMMHEGQIVLRLDGDAKAQATVPGLLSEFAKVKGAALSDKTLLN